MTADLLRVIADTPLAANIQSLLQGKVQIVPWQVALDGSTEPIAGIYTYGHPHWTAPCWTACRACG